MCILYFRFNLINNYFLSKFQFVQANKGRIGLGSLARDLNTGDSGAPPSAHEAVSNARRIELLEEKNRILEKKLADVEQVVELLRGSGDQGAGTSGAQTLPRTTGLSNDDLILTPSPTPSPASPPPDTANPTE